MERLEKELTDAGIKLFGIKEGKENLILRILETRNERYLKQIPFLLYKYDSDIFYIYKKTSAKEIFREIVRITNKIFSNNGIRKRYRYFHFDSNEKSRKSFNYKEFESEFLTQVKMSDFLLDKERIIAERGVHYSLSMIFTDKEKNILEKILSEENLTKTEYEYYIRKTKKKLESIINLEDFAKNVLTMKPNKF